MEKYGNLIKQMRLIRKMSQEDVALEINTNQSSISDYELSKHKLSFGKLIEIANALNFDVVLIAKDRTMNYTYSTRDDIYLLKYMRRRRRISARKLSQKVQYSHSTITSYERRKNRLNQEALERIADALDFDIDIMVQSQLIYSEDE